MASEKELAELVSSLTAAIDGLPVEMRLVLLETVNVITLPRWKKNIIWWLLALSFGQVIGPLVSQHFSDSSYKRSVQMLNTANQVLAKANQNNDKAVQEVKDSRSLEIFCFQNTFGHFFANMPLDDKCK